AVVIELVTFEVSVGIDVHGNELPKLPELPKSPKLINAYENRVATRIDQFPAIFGPALREQFWQLLELGSHRNVLQESREHRLALIADRGSHDHTVRFEPAQLARLEVGHQNHFASDQLFRLVSQRDSRDDLADLGADVDFEAQQSVRALYLLGELYLTHA